MHVRPFRPSDTESVVRLWEACGLVRTWNDPRRDIQRKLATQPELFLVGEDSGTVIASVMAGFDGHRGWIYYLAVDPARQRSGHGRTMVDAAELLLTDLGCPKLNLQIRAESEGVAGFYRALGFVQDDVVSLGKRLIVDD